MLDSIQGRLVHAEPGRVVVDVGGLGYEIQVPLSTYERLPAPEQPVHLLLHLSVRETEWRLFGFGTQGERRTFRALLRVTGIGPALALNVLSGFAPAEIRRAVVDSDADALTRVKGIGKKTAERIVVELRDAVDRDLPADEVGEAGAAGPSDDAVRALVALGLDPREARRRVERHRTTRPDAGLSELVRLALRG